MTIRRLVSTFPLILRVSIFLIVVSLTPDDRLRSAGVTPPSMRTFLRLFSDAIIIHKSAHYSDISRNCPNFLKLLNLITDFHSSQVILHL